MHVFECRTCYAQHQAVRRHLLIYRTYVQTKPFTNAIDGLGLRLCDTTQPNDLLMMRGYYVGPHLCD